MTSSEQMRYDIELKGALADAYGSIHNDNMEDEHTYDAINEKVSTVPVNDTTERSESKLSARCNVATVVSALILAASASVVAVFVYHNYIVNIPELRSQLTMLMEKQNKTVERLEKLMDAASRQKTLHEDTGHQLRLLQLNQANVSQQLEALEQTQANTSVSMMGLSEVQTNTNRQLEILTKQRQSPGTHVAFSVFSMSDEPIPSFSRYTVNTGHFNMTSGRFHCPIAGMYYFTFSFEHKDNENGFAQCYFHVNGEGSVFVAVRFSPNEEASGSTVHHLSVNDVVNLNCVGLKNVNTAHNNVVFSGFLISQD